MQNTQTNTADRAGPQNFAKVIGTNPLINDLTRLGVALAGMGLLVALGGSIPDSMFLGILIPVGGFILCIWALACFFMLVIHTPTHMAAWMKLKAGLENGEIVPSFHFEPDPHSRVLLIVDLQNEMIHVNSESRSLRSLQRVLANDVTRRVNNRASVNREVTLLFQEGSAQDIKINLKGDGDNSFARFRDFMMSAGHWR